MASWSTAVSSLSRGHDEKKDVRKETGLTRIRGKKYRHPPLDSGIAYS